MKKLILLGLIALQTHVEAKTPKQELEEELNELRITYKENANEPINEQDKKDLEEELKNRERASVQNQNKLKAALKSNSLSALAIYQKVLKETNKYSIHGIDHSDVFLAKFYHCMYFLKNKKSCVEKIIKKSEFEDLIDLEILKKHFEENPVEDSELNNNLSDLLNKGITKIKKAQEDFKAKVEKEIISE